MSRTRALMRKSNPLRSDISWWMVLLLGIIALAIGIYVLTAEKSARENFNFGVGIFLLINGAGSALAGRKARDVAARPAGFMLLRAGIGIATGLIIVINRLVGSMDLNQVRVVAGIGLLGMGLTTLVGRVLARGEKGGRIGTIAGALLLAAWGIVTLYQAANDTSSSRLIGWVAIIVGALYCAIAIYRRRATLRSAAVPA